MNLSVRILNVDELAFSGLIEEKLPGVNVIQKNGHMVVDLSQVNNTVFDVFRTIENAPGFNGYRKATTKPVQEAFNAECD